jgi:hypothetical protein
MRELMEKCFKPDLFLAGLPINILPGKVREIFEGVHIETAYLQIVRRRGLVMMPRAIAFVRLADSSKTEAAIEKLNNMLIGGHAITAAKYISPLARAPRAAFHSPEHPWSRAQAEAGAR